MTTRRSFVGDTARALAGLTIIGPVAGSVRIIPTRGRRGASSLSAAKLLAEHGEPVNLQALVGPTLEAAAAAGASFADVRLAEYSFLLVNSAGNVRLTSTVSYGLRVIADGGMAFIYGSVPEPERLITAARDAAATAKGLARLVTEPAELAPAAVAQGEWTTPIRTDPFTVPLQDQLDLLLGFADLENRTIGEDASFVQAAFLWEKDYRVYGSTEGARTTQVLYRSQQNFIPGGMRTLLQPAVILTVPHLALATAAGYEAVLSPSFPDRLKATIEKATELSRLPARRLDVGRYPVAMDGPLLGALFGKSVGLALELDRALGYENDASGTSYLGPPMEVLGKTVVNPLLTVTASRAMPHFHAAKWDDEGVEPTEYTLIDKGVVMDYHTSRQTAPALAPWYDRHGKAVRSNGCGVARSASDPVVVQAPHLSIAPGHEDVTLEDLYKDMNHGVALYDAAPGASVIMDQQLSGGFANGMQMVEIVRGKVVGRIKNVGLPFRTTDLWKALVTLGGAGTVEDGFGHGQKGMPGTVELFTSTAPAGLFTNLDIAQY